MWICKKCGSRTGNDSLRCSSCGAARSKPDRIRNRELEEVWTAEQQAEWEALIKRRKKIAWMILSVFLLVAVFLYFLVFSAVMEWPRPEWMPNIGRSPESPDSLGIGIRYLPY